jgi:hypothetical protein
MTRTEFGKLFADDTEKWGKGDPRRQHQAGVIHPGSGNPSHSMAATKKVQHVADL